MTNPTASDPIGPGHIMVPNNSPETSEDRATIQHDEHIARLTQEIEDLRSELTRVRDLTNLSITLQSPFHEPRSTVPNPPCFPSLDSPVPEHFPPQQPPPTNNNLPSSTPTNPSNFPPVYTPPQSQPPTYTTYATPPNPPLVNPQNQPPTHTPHVSLPINIYPLPTTNHVNPSNTPPPIQNTPIVQTYTAQHIQGAHIATPYVKHVPPVYAVETQAFTNPIPKMITMMGQKFTEIIRMGEILEEGIKSGRIQDFTALHAASKAIQYGSINGNKKKKEDVKIDTLSAFDAHIMTTHEQALIEVTAATSYMPLYDSETLTIWGAEPEETLKNWTCTPSLVRRESW
ncbi:hypothetical protein H5410_011010 [Solanum commersonii]|uniref:Uncharacterized protein n=1 Tax=Solanum commersonii TaxID=4109 RepID=A0A9J6AMB8_SOLCO|nr:hypothetical protein H5410_011010 [Solanum commersonii]